MYNGKREGKPTRRDGKSEKENRLWIEYCYLEINEAKTRDPLAAMGVFLKWKPVSVLFVQASYPRASCCGSVMSVLCVLRCAQLIGNASVEVRC